MRRANARRRIKNDHKAYIGAALHNIGILQLLRSEFEEALSFFEKAAGMSGSMVCSVHICIDGVYLILSFLLLENRKDHFGEGSVDHLVRVLLFH